MSYIDDIFQWVLVVIYIVRDKTAFSMNVFIVHHIKITIHLPYCDAKLVYNNNIITSGRVIKEKIIKKKRKISITVTIWQGITIQGLYCYLDG